MVGGLFKDMLLRLHPVNVLLVHNKLLLDHLHCINTLCLLQLNLHFRRDVSGWGPHMGYVCGCGPHMGVSVHVVHTQGCACGCGPHMGCVCGCGPHIGCICGCGFH